MFFGLQILILKAVGLQIRRNSNRAGKHIVYVQLHSSYYAAVHKLLCKGIVAYVQRDFIPPPHFVLVPLAWGQYK